MKARFTIFLFSMISLMFLGCSEDNDIEINNPSTYSFTRNGESTVDFNGQTTRILMATELINAMKDFSTNESSLVEMYSNQTLSGGDADPFSDSDLNSSSKSVKSKVAASSDFFSTNTADASIIKDEIQSWISAQTTEVFPSESTLAESGVAGQIADGSSVRYVNAQGLEYNQAVNKSLIGALMVDQICNNYLSPLVLDAGQNVSDNNQEILVDEKPYTNMEHKWDEAYGYLFGISMDVSDPLVTLGEGSFLNKYLSRVEDDSDFTGIANDIFNAFKLGRAAIVAGDYSVRDEQAEILREKIAVVIGVRAIYYLQNGKRALENGDFGGAFHDLSEGFGFVYSLRFIRIPDSTDSYFTRSEVDGYINQLLAGNGFWDIEASTLDSISESIAEKFDFSVVEASE